MTNNEKGQDEAKSDDGERAKEEGINTFDM